MLQYLHEELSDNSDFEYLAKWNKLRNILISMNIIFIKPALQAKVELNETQF